ncbi:putative lipid-binding protein AIR1 [Neltuma alba]|uniref:putative lipid-binding protein AIR1 n=1 Tax=Neltuma alba TaxID=207710 RepID=UPI0010A2ED04|nr:putative lipid-binding protein AIR1 [Prosopis alba]
MGRFVWGSLALVGFILFMTVPAALGRIKEDRALTCRIAKPPSHPPARPAATSATCSAKADRGRRVDLFGLMNVKLGKLPKNLCSLIQGLDLEAAVCLCAAFKANVLGIDLNVATKVDLFLKYCGKGTVQKKKAASPKRLHRA